MKSALALALTYIVVTLKSKLVSTHFAVTLKLNANENHSQLGTLKVHCRKLDSYTVGKLTCEGRCGTYKGILGLTLRDTGQGI